jgi:hypothetical protein
LALRLLAALMRDDRTMSVTVGQDDIAGAEDRAEVVRRELLLLDPAVRADKDRVRELLHPNFVEFGASGRIWDAATMVDALATDSASIGSEPDSASISSMVADLIPASLSADVVLITYRIDDPARPRLRSAVWLRNADGKWLLRFHQGTLARSRE